MNRKWVEIIRNVVDELIEQRYQTKMTKKEKLLQINIKIHRRDKYIDPMHSSIECGWGRNLDLFFKICV